MSAATALLQVAIVFGYVIFWRVRFGKSVFREMHDPRTSAEWWWPYVVYLVYAYELWGAGCAAWAIHKLT